MVVDVIERVEVEERRRGAVGGVVEAREDVASARWGSG